MTDEQRIYLDTFVFMDMLSGQKDVMEKAKVYISQPAVVSSVVLTELMFHLLRHGAKEKADETVFYVKSLPNLEIADVTGEIAEMAGKLRSRYANKLDKNLTYFDSIHIATALAYNVKKFVTGDKDFRRILDLKIEVY
ncbi:MAG TPA: PIN domain-containing protein [archaeon]|nr:PIN domain-containing protein [archaeon]